jgi:hypothetical protein
MDPGLAVGNSGRVLGNALVGISRSKLNSDLFRLFDRSVLSPSLMGGFPGYAYALSFCKKTKLERRTLKILMDRHDLQIPHYLRHYGKYELFNGATGIGVYALQCSRGEALENVLEYLECTLQETRWGWIWRAPEDYLSIQSSVPKLRSQFNLGIAHGCLGPALFLVRVCEDDKRLSDWAKRILIKIWPALKNEAEKSLNKPVPYARPVPKDNPKPPPLSWCYGDAGFGFAFCHIAKVLGKDNELKIGLKILKRDLY